jgi:hypothetical protein
MVALHREVHETKAKALAASSQRRTHLRENP